MVQYNESVCNNLRVPSFFLDFDFLNVGRYSWNFIHKTIWFNFYNEISSNSVKYVYINIINTKYIHHSTYNPTPILFSDLTLISPNAYINCIWEGFLLIHTNQFHYIHRFWYISLYIFHDLKQNIFFHYSKGSFTSFERFFTISYFNESYFFGERNFIIFAV